MTPALGDIEVTRRSAVAMDQIRRSRLDHERQRPPALTAREALVALQFEALVVYLMACQIKAGATLPPCDVSRLATCCARLDLLVDEVMRAGRA